MTEYVRKRHMMYQISPESKTRVTYRACESISQAKRLSRELQAKGNKVTVDHDDDPKPKRKRDTGDAADKFIARKTRELREQRLAERRAEKSGPNTITLKKQA